MEEKNKSLEVGNIFRMSITDLTSEGSGVGRINNLAVFVDGALPGETVEAKITGIKKNYLTSKSEIIILPSEHRKIPFCPVFDKCGGCVLQHMSYDYQLIYKTKKVRDAVERISGIKDIKINEIIGAEQNKGYRNKSQYFFDGNSGEISCGFFERKSHKVVNHDNCFIVSGIVNSLKNKFIQFVKENKISIYDESKHAGFLKSTMIRQAFGTNELMLVIIGAAHPGEKLKESLENLPRYLMEKVPYLKSIYLAINTASGNYAVGDKIKHLWGSKFIVEKIGGLKFHISPDSFFQINTEQTKVLYNTIMEFADLKGSEAVLDLFCGTGTIGLFMAKKTSMIFGIDIVKSAINDATDNAQLNNIKNAEFVSGDAFEILSHYSLNNSIKGKDVIENGYNNNDGNDNQSKNKSHISSNIDVLVADPPRNGLGEDLVNLISDLSIKKIIYVSCNPSTLARDIKSFHEKGYKVEQIQPIDMFPHTEHVECVVLLTNVTSK